MRYLRVWMSCGMMLGVAALVGAVAVADDPTPPAAGGGPDIVTVSVTGKSAISADEAIKDGLRNAVERAAGVFIDSQSKTENYQLVHDIVVSRSKGYVKSYKPLNDPSIKGDDGAYLAELKCDVMTKAVADDWTGMRSILLQKGMPRFMFSVSETVDGQPTEFNTAQTQVEKVLLKFGIPMVDKNQIDDVAKKDLAAARLADDVAKIAALATRFKADIIVVGKSSSTLTKERSAYGVKVIVYNANVEMRGFHSTNAKLIFADSAQGETDQASNKEEAARRALEVAGQDMARRFVLGLMDTWVTELSKGVGTDYNLEVSGIKFAQVNALKKELSANTKLISHCELKDYSNDVALFVLGCSTSTTNLALWMADLKSVKLDITQVNPGSVKAKIIEEK